MGFALKSHKVYAVCASIAAAFTLLSCAAPEKTSDHSSRTNIPVAETESETRIPDRFEIKSETDELRTELLEIEDASSELTETEEMETEVLAIEPSLEYKGMTVTALNVGQGLSILINADDHLLLYDGGGRESSSYVVSYLEQNGYTDFDYMIASHYDEDHIAGLIGCLHNYTFQQVLCPDYEATTEIYQSFVKGLELNGAEIVHPLQGDEYPLGNAIVSVLGPTAYGSSKDNNNSIVIRVAYGDYSCIITGDAEIEEENAILASGVDLKSDLYIVGHHGSSNSSGEEFVKAIAPTAAFISCGEYNDYGHPTLETLSLLEKYNIDIYRTDKQAEISCVSDAKNYEFSTAPCEDHSTGAEPLKVVEKTEEPATPENNTSTYILNTNTKKFHYPGCGSVKTMKDKNKQEVEATREEIISRGYDPCGNCHP